METAKAIPTTQPINNLITNVEKNKFYNNFNIMSITTKKKLKSWKNV